MASNNNTISVDDPHYGHPSDVPGTKLVSNVFEGNGFGNWKRAMKIALSAKNKIAFIDGSCPKPASTDPMEKYWQRCNDIVFSWILNSVSPEIADSILYSSTAELAWQELEERYGQSNGAQFYGIQKKLSEFSQGNDGITSYFTKLKSIWDEIEGMGMHPKCSYICVCGDKAKQLELLENKKVIQFLMGLNDSYNIVRGSILMQTPLPKLSVAYNNLIQEERQREIHHSQQFQADTATAMLLN